MSKCFEDNIECTELLLHIVMENEGIKVQRVRTKYQIKNLQGRSVRLDIWATDSKGRKINIEIQREDKGAGAKRARYHSSVMDANITSPGEDYEELAEVYVIFITENDIIGEGIPLYHIERTIQETGGCFGDGSHIIYVNGQYRDDSPLGILMKDFACTEPDDMHYKVLADRARYFKKNKEGVASMCKMLEEMRNEAAAEATENERLSSVRKLMEKLKLTAEEAMDMLEISKQEQKRYLKRL